MFSVQVWGKRGLVVRAASSSQEAWVPHTAPEGRSGAQWLEHDQSPDAWVLCPVLGGGSRVQWLEQHQGVRTPGFFSPVLGGEWGSVLQRLGSRTPGFSAPVLGRGVQALNQAQ